MWTTHRRSFWESANVEVIATELVVVQAVLVPGQMLADLGELVALGLGPGAGPGDAPVGRGSGIEGVAGSAAPTKLARTSGHLEGQFTEPSGWRRRPAPRSVFDDVVPVQARPSLREVAGLKHPDGLATVGHERGRGALPTSGMAHPPHVSCRRPSANRWTLAREQ